MFYLYAIVLILQLFSSQPECGIPIKNWLAGYFGYQIVWQVYDLYSIRRQLPIFCYHKYVSWAIKSVKEGLFVAYLIYGNVMFYSKENECKTKDYPDYLTMLFIICIGYVYFFFIGIIAVFVVITLYLEISNRVNKHRKKYKYHRVLKKLKKVKYSTRAGLTQECVICWADFADRDEITVMSCDDRHHFHKACIESWVK